VKQKLQQQRQQQQHHHHHQQPVSLWLHSRQKESSASIANMKLGPGGPREGTISSQTNGSKRTKEWTLKDDDILGIFEIPTG